MITLQFARNTESLKEIGKRDVERKSVKNCIIIFANCTVTARTWTIADFTTQKESKKSQCPVFNLEMETDQRENMNVVVGKVLKK